MVLVSISHSESILSTVSLCSNESVSLDSYHFHGNGLDASIITQCFRESLNAIVSDLHNGSSHSIVTISGNDPYYTTRVIYQ